jgi:hypothetical protein
MFPQKLDLIIGLEIGRHQRDVMASFSIGL